MRSEMEKDILKVLVSEEELKTRIAEMGEELYEKFQGKNPIFLGVLKGSFVFIADLMRACQLKSDIEFIAVSSYANATESSGRVRIVQDVQHDITGRDIIVVEDILDKLGLFVWELLERYLNMIRIMLVRKILIELF